MNQVVVGLVALAGLAVTALGTWLVARRKTSGHIDTSEAADLWRESQAMRKELRDEVGLLRAKLDRAYERIDELEAHVHELEGRHA